MKGGWPRLWFPDGGILDLEFTEDEAGTEARWRGVAKVEWLSSPKGRLDRWLPQTLLRQVRNQNARSPSKHRRRRNVTG